MADPKPSDITEQACDNYRMDVQYDGQDYYGWQRHKDNPTIQGALENAVTECFELRHNVEGSGRTDRGTHAVGQVATVRLPKNIDEKETLERLNSYLKQTIRITEIQKVSKEFHARESAIGKQYNYKIWNHPDLPPDMDGKVWYIPEKLDFNAIQSVCSLFTGEMDYASFAKVPNYKRATSIRTVHAFDMAREGSLLNFSIIADGFLYKMVRNIIRAIVKVGEGRTKKNDLIKIIASKSRKAAPGTAPASGLYLDSVFYDQESLNAAIKNIAGRNK